MDEEIKIHFLAGGKSCETVSVNKGTIEKVIKTINNNLSVFDEILCGTEEVYCAIPLYLQHFHKQE
jgi:hypothetical protein